MASKHMKAHEPPAASRPFTRSGKGRALVEFTGTARLGRRTKQLVRRLTDDDVAIIDHVDLDRVSAEELLESGVRVVVNVAASASGRFPNPRPLELVGGGGGRGGAAGAERVG